MAALKSTVHLKSSQQAFVQRQIDAGYYDDVSDVLDDALRALDERRAVYDEFLRAKVKAALADSRPAIPIEEAFRRAHEAVADLGKATAK